MWGSNQDIDHKYLIRFYKLFDVLKFLLPMIDFSMVRSSKCVIKKFNFSLKVAGKVGAGQSSLPSVSRSEVARN